MKLKSDFVSLKQFSWTLNNIVRENVKLKKMENENSTIHINMKL